MGPKESNTINARANKDRINQARLVLENWQKEIISREYQTGGLGKIKDKQNLVLKLGR